MIGAKNGRKERRLVNTKRAFKYRIEGKTYAEIATILGVTAPTAYNYVKEETDILRDKVKEDAETLFQLEHERLNVMLDVVMPKAKKADLPSVEKVLKISEQIRKLHGLDKPIKIAPTNPEGTEQYNPDYSFKDLLLNKFADRKEEKGNRE